MSRTGNLSLMISICLILAGSTAQAQCITYEPGAGDVVNNSCGMFNCNSTVTKYWNIYWHDSQNAVTANRYQYATKGTGIWSKWMEACCDPIFYAPTTTASAGNSSVWEQRVISTTYGSGGNANSCGWSADTYFNQVDATETAP